MPIIRRDNRDTTRNVGSGYRWDPFRAMDALLRWDALRDDVSSGASGASSAAWAGELTARFDVKEAKDAFVLVADVPGVRDEDIDITLNSNMLTVSGKRELEAHDEGDRYFALERGYGSFARSFALPDSVDGEHVTADLKNGVLTVHIPKRPEAQPKKIAIGRRDDAGAAKA